MAGNRVVARFRDGRTVKGTTADFSPQRSTLHIQTEQGIELVDHRELKAIFFVRDFEGDRRHQKSNLFSPDRPVVGRKIAVRFADGEILVGTTQGYRPDRPGFFVVPADHQGNAERCWIVTSATAEVRMF
jgi:hypothetical protein